MGAIGTALLTQLGATGVTELAKQGGYAISNLTGYNDAISRDQLEQQKKLTDIQQNANFEAMDKQQQMQKEMYEHTFGIQSKYDSAAEQVKRYKEAGLNPALMYTNGSAGMAGGTTGSAGMGSVSGGNASDEASRKAIDLQQQGMALQNAKLASEIEVNKSIAKSNNANAETTDKTRSIIIENARQAGISQYLENIANEWKVTGGNIGLNYNVEGFGLEQTLNPDAYIGQEASNIILKSIADTGNANAQALLNNKKAEGYFQELINATAHADADTVKALAMKLTAEFNTGEFTNWKTWADLGLQATQVVGGVVTKGIAAGKPAGNRVTNINVNP